MESCFFFDPKDSPRGTFWHFTPQKNLKDLGEFPQQQWRSPIGAVRYDGEYSFGDKDGQGKLSWCDGQGA